MIPNACPVNRTGVLFLLLVGVGKLKVMTRLFATPDLLWALAVLPALAGLALWSQQRRRKLVVHLGPPGVIAGQIERMSGSWRTFVGWALGLIFLIAGAAGPHWGLGPPPPTAPGRDVVVVVDVSRSMLAQDALPSRLGKARDALREFADAVQSRGGHRLGLVAFAGQAAVVCPLTHDYDHFRAKLAALLADPPPHAVRAIGTEAVSGTRIGTGLQRAVSLLALEPQFRGAQGILLVSDGDDPAEDEEWRAGLAAAREAGLPVDVAGIGDSANDSPIPTSTGHLTFRGAEVRTKLQEGPLREIAARTGGTYLAIRTGPPALDAYFRDRVAMAATREAISGTLPQPIGRQVLFFSIALTFIVGTMFLLSPWAAVRVVLRSMRRAFSRTRRPAAVFAAFVFISAAPPAEWLRRGNDELAAGHPAAALVEFGRAAEWTTDPGRVAFNEGVALYHLGRFREAEMDFRRSLADATGGRRTRAFYNLGCSLLGESQGRIAGPLRAAVASFEQGLAGIRSDDPLADPLRHNLELAKRMLDTVRTASPNQTEESPDDRQPGRPPLPRGGPDDGNPPVGHDQGAAQTGPDGQPLPKGKTDGNSGPQTTDNRPPGKGQLPPLPDEDALSPLSFEDARAHLQKAVERIAAERRAQLDRTAPAAATRFPEW
jgi:Ca-activated chloride channel family protein